MLDGDINTQMRDIESYQVTRQRLYFDMGKCFYKSFQSFRALDSFLLSLTLALGNGDKYPLKINTMY